MSNELLNGQVRQSFFFSDRTYGARRVWHDKLALRQQCGLHLIELLMREQALRARPRRRGLPADRGTCSAIADNVLNRQFPSRCTESKISGGFHIHLDSRGLALYRCSAGPVLAPHCLLVNAEGHNFSARG